jgi:peptidyl-prolyl cis-trans isomerase D
MLSSLRTQLKERQWPKWLLVLVALSFTLYLGAYYSCDKGQGGAEAEWAAKIDGKAIPAAQFRAYARQLDQRYRQFLGASYNDLRTQVRLGSQAIEQVVDRELILADAAALGLRVSDAELIENIRTNPALLDSSGKFVGKAEYERRLRGVPGGVSTFEHDLALDLLVQKWTDLVGQSVTVDDRDLEDLHRRRTEKTAVDSFVVRLSDATYDTQVTAEQAHQFYDAHPERYNRPAGRRIRYVLLDRQSQAAQIHPTDEELQKEYAASSQRYSHPEQRRASHILFRVEPGADVVAKAKARARAGTAIDRLERGEGFAALARELSEDKLSAERGGDLGWFARGQMVGPFENAAFETAVDKVAPITETDFGYHVIQVTGTRPAGTSPFEEVRSQVEQQLRSRLAEERVTAEAARIRAKIPSSEKLDAVAAEEKLRVEKRFVAPSEGLNELALAPEAQTAILTLEPGTVSQPVRSARGLVIAVTDELVPAGRAPFEEAEARVRGDVIDERSHEAALTAARRAMAGAKDLRTAAKVAGKEVESSTDLAPGQTQPAWGGDSPELRAALFGASVAVGNRGVVAVPTGALAYEVTRRVPFDAAAFGNARAALRNELVQERQTSIVRSLLDQMRKKREIVINQPLIQQLDGQT